MTAPDITRPQIGFYKAKLVKGGPDLPARIYRPCPCVLPEPEWDIDPWGRAHPVDWMTPARMHYRPLEAEIDGEPVPVERVWTGGRPISYREWKYLTDAAGWDRAHDPEAPMANPRKPVDHQAQLRRIDPIF